LIKTSHCSRFLLSRSINTNHYPITQDFFMAKFFEASNCIYFEAIVILNFAILQ
jgi:hypothetical protein